jgi:hypothetical protein
MSTYFKAGTWNCVCALCGREFKSDEVIKRWDGLYVCKNDYEPRHILDFARVPQAYPPVPFTAPEPTDQFITVPYAFLTLGMADLGGADLAGADVYSDRYF